MHQIQRRARQQGSIVGSFNLHFCKMFFQQLEPVSSWSHGNNFTCYTKAHSHHLKQKYSIVGRKKILTMTVHAKQKIDFKLKKADVLH